MHWLVSGTVVEDMEGAGLEGTSGNGSFSVCTSEELTSGSVEVGPGVVSLSFLLETENREPGSTDSSLSFPFQGLPDRIPPGLVTGLAECSGINTRLAGVCTDVRGVPSGLKPSRAAFCGETCP